MADSPIIRPTQAPLDPQEEPVLNSLLGLREQLSRLKEDKSTYIKSQDIFPLNEEVVKQVHLLNDIRKEKREEQNRGW